MIMQHININLTSDNFVVPESRPETLSGDNTFSEIMHGTINDVNRGVAEKAPVTEKSNTVSHDDNSDSPTHKNEVQNTEKHPGRSEIRRVETPGKSVSEAETEDVREYSDMMGYMDDRKTLDQVYDLSGFKQFLAEKNLDLIDMTGFDLLMNLKEFLTSQGISLSEISVNKEGLKQLSGLLSSLGLDKHKIDEFLAESGNEDKDSFNIAEILSYLEDDITSPIESSEILDISAHPFLSAILSGYGLTDGEINSALSSATIEGTGIDLVKLLDNIKEMFSNLENKSASVDVNMIREHMIRLDLMDEESAKTPASLMEFAAVLNKHIKKRTIIPLDNKKPEANLQGFLQNLKTDNSSSDSGNKADNSMNHKLNLLNGEIGTNNSGSDISAKDTIPNTNPETLTNAVPLKPEITNKSPKDSKPGHVVDPLTTGTRNGENTEVVKPVFEMSEKNYSDGKSQTMPDHIKPAVPNAGGDNELLSADKSQDAKPPVKTLPTHVMNQVNRQMARSLVNGSDNIIINLKPAHLGRLQVNLENSTGSMRVSVIAESQTTKEILASHAQELKSILSEQGIKVEKVNVELSSNFDQFNGNNKENQFHEKWQRNSNRNSGLSKNGNDVTPEDNIENTGTTGSGRKLDLVA